MRLCCPCALCDAGVPGDSEQSMDEQAASEEQQHCEEEEEQQHEAEVADVQDAAEQQAPDQQNKVRYFSDA